MEFFDLQVEFAASDDVVVEYVEGGDGGQARARDGREGVEVEAVEGDENGESKWDGEQWPERPGCGPTCGVGCEQH